jgi:hypothetical protein
MIGATGTVRPEMCDIFELDRMSTSKLCFLENALKRRKNMDVFSPAVSGRTVAVAQIEVEGGRA